MTEQTEIILLGQPDAAWNTLASQLKGLRTHVVSFSDLNEAKSYMQSKQPGMAFINMDTLPDAQNLIREFTFLFRGLPIMASSAKGSVHEAKLAIDAGAADYLLLPVEREILNTHIERYHNQFFDPELGRGRRLVTGDPGMQKLLNQVRRVSNSTATVLIQGESGTGKELMARYVHQVSDRAKGPFIAINCAALPENLLESELFGHAKGAFTGATSDRKGKFLQANGGTIFLDEISEMSLSLQAKLLRVLQEREVDPVGGKAPIELDVRVIASTNRDLKLFSSDGHFREDLYYRLNVFPVFIPPLRNRPKDIVLLADMFRQRFVQEFGRNEIPFAPETYDTMRRYSWPGNIRELENVVQRALLMADGQMISSQDMMIEADQQSVVETVMDSDQIQMPVGTTVREMEEILIRRTLDEVDGNRTRAAEILGISIRTLRNKLNEYAARIP
uniref:Two-component sigma 54 dependent transcriptional regulator, Fis family n=1 Tax=Magnetococcus massalia (strain MO-1) TaxID=451514 RepID=A0A1S7LMC9_MAGMO|nr:Two-component sigma 54 dependent transcriptional regulator, Fis family [Candidatus Magnetococcus massalia]